MTKFNNEEFNKLYFYKKKRFPDAKFLVSCFDTIDEVNTKQLTDANEILYFDEYMLNGKPLLDYYLIRKKEGQTHILYCDVIDELIKQGLVRNDCSHRYLESIICLNDIRRNSKSLPLYGSFWGS